MHSINDFRAGSNHLTSTFNSFTDNTRTYVVQKELEVEALKRNVADLNIANDAKRSEVSSLVGANEKMRQDLLSAQIANGEKIKEVTSLTASNEALRKEVANCQAVIDAKYREVSQLVSGNESLRKELGLSQASVNSKASENISLNASADNLRKDLQAAQAVCSTKIGEVTSLLAANERLRGELKIAQGEKTRLDLQLQSALSTAKNNDQALRATLVNKDMDITRLRSDLAVSRSETDKLNKLLGLYSTPTVKPYTITQDAQKMRSSANDIVATSDRVLKSLSPDAYAKYL